MKRKKVLFICIHNSGRSQMAETFMNHIAGDRYDAESAGFQPTVINPLVVTVMKEIGFDLSSKKTQSVFDLFKQGKLYDFVVTVCDESTESRCPIFPGIVKRAHLPFRDPESLTGTDEEKLAALRIIRDQIRTVLQNKIDEW